MWWSSVYKSLQRAGQIRLLATLSSASRAEEPRALAGRYSSQLLGRHRVSGDEAEAVARWRHVRGARGEDANVAQWQEMALAAPGLESATGTENESSVAKAPLALVSLGLARHDTFTRTPLGQLWALKQAPDARDAYVVTPELRYFTLRLIQDRDRGVSMRALPRLPDGVFHFYEDAMVALAIEVVASLGDDRDRSSPQQGDRTRATDLHRQMSAAARGGSSVSRETRRRVFEDFWLPRLELWTDAGLLAKPEPAAYRYERAVDVATPDADIAQTVFGGLAEPGVYKDAIQAAYHRISSAVGYAPVYETVLDANAILAAAGQPVGDVHVGIDLVRSAAKRKTPAVRLALDRDGRASSFKLIGEL